MSRILPAPAWVPTLIVLAALSSFPLPGADTSPVRYEISFPAPQTHYVEVKATLPASRKPFLELMMPVWTPGSYLVREYAKNVENLTARTPDGQALTVEKTRKNRWKIATSGAPAIEVSYRVYCHMMSVQGIYVEKDFAILNAAGVFPTIAGELSRPHDVKVILPDGWKTTVSPLPSIGKDEYRAADYDTLIDSPLLAGNPSIYEFDVSGKKHYLVNEGEGGVWDGPRSARDVEKIVRENLRFWGSLPYPRYVFFNLITESGGGLEHKDSTLMMTNRWATRTAKAYRGWLGLVSHEYFHAWNVKRLRPVELGPFDYENENYTKSLWIAEGFTSYYGPLNLRRAGLTTQREYLEAISGAINALQNIPGRLVQPLETSSYDAWIKLYRPDENTPNTAISYYTKGSVVGFLLDAKIRKATAGAKSLDDVMRLAYQRYSGAHGYTPAGFRKTAEDVANLPLADWFTKSLNSTDELDYEEALAWFGLRFKPEEPPKPDAPPKVVKGWLGATTNAAGGRLVVTTVRRGTPAYDAGFNVDDEIIAIDDYRVRADQWDRRMESYEPGDKVSILVARRDKLVRLPVVLGKEPEPAWRLEPDPKATDDQKAHLKAWLEAKHEATPN